VLTVTEIRTEITKRIQVSIAQESATPFRSVKVALQRERAELESFKRWINDRLKEDKVK
jgi:hypothetical protein